MTLYALQVIAFRDLVPDVTSKIRIINIFVICYANWSRPVIVDIFTIYLTEKYTGWLQRFY